MTKLHAQMALLGSIDEVVRNSTNPETVATIEKLLPGTTGVGQQGWFRELQHFLNRPELKPRDKNGLCGRGQRASLFPGPGAGTHRGGYRTARRGGSRESGAGIKVDLRLDDLEQSQ